MRNPHPAKPQGIPVEKGSGNVYADLGFPDSEDMLVKAQLVTKIAEIIRQRRLTQAQAAKLVVKQTPHRRAQGQLTIRFA